MLDKLTAGFGEVRTRPVQHDDEDQDMEAEKDDE